MLPRRSTRARSSLIAATPAPAKVPTNVGSHTRRVVSVTCTANGSRISPATSVMAVGMTGPINATQQADRTLCPASFTAARRPASPKTIVEPTRYTNGAIKFGLDPPALPTTISSTPATRLAWQPAISAPRMTAPFAMVLPASPPSGALASAQNAGSSVPMPLATDRSGRPGGTRGSAPPTRAAATGTLVPTDAPSWLAGTRH